MSFFNFSIGQIKVLSSGKSEVVFKKINDSSITDTFFIEQDEGLKTKTLHANKVYKFNMFLLREQSHILINIEVLGNPEEIEYLAIERKTSHSLSNYRVFKTFTEDEIKILLSNKNIKIKDVYPESNKLDSYYRIQYREKYKEMIKYVSTVKLEAFKTSSNVIYGEQEEKRSSMFYTHEDTVTYQDNDFGLQFEVKRNSITNEFIIKNLNFTNLEGKWDIERKTSHYLSSFRKVKILSNSDLESLLEKKVFVYTDKYPESRKLSSFYRLTYTDIKNHSYSLEPIELKGITGTSK